MNTRLPNSHQFVQLRQGRCHFRFEGPERGPLMLLLHGATVPTWELDRIVPFFKREGFRTLQVDLFGHGYSACPRVPHDYSLFTDQIRDLLDALDIKDTIHVLGHSLGAIVASRLVMAEPRRFGALILVAPLLNYLENNPETRWLKIPVLGELLIPSLVLPMLQRRRTRSYQAIEDGRFVSLFRVQVELPGYGRSLLSLIRHGALGDQSDCYEALNALQNPVLMIRGTQDRILKAEQMQSILQLLPRAKFQEISNTGHPLLLTHPEMVAPHVLQFMHDHINPVPHNNASLITSDVVAE